MLSNVKGDSMKALLKNDKGTTLIDVLLSIAIIGVIAIPLMMCFTSIIVLSNMSSKQLDTNSVIRTIKENVSNAVKAGNVQIQSYDDLNSDGLVDGADAVVLRAGAVLSGGSNFKVIDANGREYGSYSFDLTVDNTSVPSPEFQNTYEYIIDVKKRSTSPTVSDQVIKRIRLRMNILPDAVP
ncbi:MAG: hypothetical protein N3B21_06375 [Clostridia bacterium]|nr:hypothetical protein [Clostridia bacterium]